MSRDWIVSGGLGGSLNITDGYGIDYNIFEGGGELVNKLQEVDGAGRMFFMRGGGELVNRLQILKGYALTSYTFEFSGSDISSVDEQAFHLATSFFRSKKDGLTYSNAYSRVVTSREEYVKERKIVIKVKKENMGLLINGRKYKPLLYLDAIYDDEKGTILIDKRKTFDAAFFSNMVGHRNYIFTLDANRRILTVGVMEDLEKGIAGKKNVLNNVSFLK